MCEEVKEAPLPNCSLYIECIYVLATFFLYSKGRVGTQLITSLFMWCGLLIPTLLHTALYVPNDFHITLKSTPAVVLLDSTKVCIPVVPVNSLFGLQQGNMSVPDVI